MINLNHFERIVMHADDLFTLNEISSDDGIVIPIVKLFPIGRNAKSMSL